MNKPTVMVTGASGFIGRCLCQQLVKQGHPVIGVYRNSNPPKISELNGIKPLLIDNIDDSTNWSEIPSDCDVIIHLAARVHQMNDTVANPLEAFRKVNTYGTLKLAQHAEQLGVKQFIFLSSIGVNGAATTIEKPFTENDVPRPYTPYTQSKWEAESELNKLASVSNIVVTHIRPPLVYGPGNPGNLLRLFKLVDTGLPLPFRTVKNKKSFVGIDNLVSALIKAIDHKNARNETFVVADDQSVSLPHLLRIIAQGLDVPSRLIPFPVPLLLFLTRMIGKQGPLKQLTDSLVIDNRKIKEQLEWQPIRDTDDGLIEAARAYANDKKSGQRIP